MGDRRNIAGNWEQRLRGQGKLPKDFLQSGHCLLQKVTDGRNNA